GAEEEAGEEPVICGQVFEAVAEAVEAIHEGAELAAVARAHLLISTEEIFQPNVQGMVAVIGLDDPGGVAKLVIENHVPVTVFLEFKQGLQGVFAKEELIGVLEQFLY